MKLDAMTDRDIGRLFSGIRGFKKLSLDDERRLAREIREGSPEALNQLVESNLPYVVKIALEYCTFGMPLQDLVNEGSLGLIEAAKRFDPEREVKFISYATWWIRKSMLRALSRQIRIVHVPWYQSKNYRNINEAREKLRESLGRGPTPEELSEALPLSRRVIDRTMRNQRREISLDQPLTENADTNLEELISAEDGLRAEQDLIRRDTARVLRLLLRGLSRRKRLILSLRFGMHGGSGMKLREIGKLLNLSRERVRQIEAEALDEMRSLMECDKRSRDRRLAGPQRA